MWNSKRIILIKVLFCLALVPSEVLCNVRVMRHETSAARGVTLGSREIAVAAGKAIYLKFQVEDWEKKRGQQTYMTSASRVPDQKLRKPRETVGDGPADIADHKLLETCVYDISDLVDAIVDPNTGRLINYSEDDANDILRRIIDTVDPNSWHKAGGEGAITIYKGNKLAVFQTRNVHQKIERLLESMRASPREQIKTKPAIQIESRFLMVSEGFLEDVGLDANSIQSDDVWSEHLVSESPAIASSDTYILILDDLHVRFLLKSAQAHKDTALLAAPRITVFDTKKAQFRLEKTVDYVSGYSEPNRPSGDPIPEHDSVNKGLQLQVTPKIMPDGNHILSDIDFDLSELIGFETRMYKGKYPYEIPQMDIINFKNCFAVPNGRTLLIGGQKVTAEENGQKVQKELLVLIKAEKVDSENLGTGDTEDLPTYKSRYGGFRIDRSAGARPGGYGGGYGGYGGYRIDRSGAPRYGRYGGGYGGYGGYGGGYSGYGGYGEDPNAPDSNSPSDEP